MVTSGDSAAYGSPPRVGIGARGRREVPP